MNVKNLVLGIGIIIVFGLLLWQGIEAFYPSPQYEVYCNSTRYNYPYPADIKPLGPQENCNFSRELQDKQNECYNNGGTPIFEYNERGCSVSVKECDYCNKYFNEAQDDYSQIVFIISLIAGIIALFVG